MTIPQFTAELSLLTGRNVGASGTTFPQDTANYVEPAMKAVCVSLSYLLADSIVYGNPTMQLVITRAMISAGCFG